MEVTNDKTGDGNGLKPNPVIVDGEKPSTGAPSSPPSPGTQPIEPKQPFAAPQVLEAIVDPKTKAKEAAVPFSFTSPQVQHAKAALPTKGDVAKAEEPVKPKLTLEQLDAEIAAETKSADKYTIDDYVDTATMFIEGWEAVLTFAARMISKDSSESAYEFSTAKKERLILQATKVSRKKNWVMPIEYLFMGTLLPASATILLRAQDNRKKYFATHKEEKKDTGKKQEGDPKPGRRPGRPSK